MVITKFELKILKYVYTKKNVSYKKLNNKFSKKPHFSETLDALVYHHYLIQVDGSHTKYGAPIPFMPDTMFAIDSLGVAEVENRQWFDSEYVVSHIIIPIVLAVISTLITLFLSDVL